MPVSFFSKQFNLFGILALGLCISVMVSGCTFNINPEKSSSSDSSGEAVTEEPAPDTTVEVNVNDEQDTGSGVIQTQETDFDGVVADLLECKQTNGYISVKVRFRNTDEKRSIYVDLKDPVENAYIQTASEKLMMMKDANDKPLMSEFDHDFISKDGGTKVWWAKFQVPSESLDKIEVVIPNTLPFSGVPLSS